MVTVRIRLLVYALAAILLVLVLGPGASPAGAHATLTGTTPAADELLDAPPDAVELRFDEPVETVEDAVRVFGPGGERVDAGTVEVVDGGATLRAGVDGEAEGTYTVAWRVTSEDSHTLSGSFVYNVGTRTGAVDVDGDGGDTTTAWVGGAGRWLGFAGALAAIGAASVALLLVPRPRPSVALHGDAGSIGTPRTPAGTGSDAGAGAPDGGAPGPDARAAGDAALDRGAPARQVGAALDRLRLLALGGAVAGVVGAAVALVAMVAESSGRGVYDAIAVVGDIAPDTRTGRLALARIGLVAVAAVLAAVPALWRRSPLPVLVAAAGSLVTVTLAGHAWTAPNRWVAVASDLAHLGAVAVWTGGLLALLVALPALPSGDGRARLVTRFSAVALGAVVVVAVSGTVSGWQQVRTLDALTSTAYGRLLLAKVAGFAVLVVLGWLNRRRLVPLVERTVAPLTRSLWVEVAVAAVILGLTAALIHQPPARADVTEPYQTTVSADGGTLDLTVDPAAAGPNDLHLYFLDAAGTAPLAVDAVQVTASTSGVPARRLPVTPVSTNHVTVAGASLPSAGTWTIEVTAIRAGVPLVFTSEVPIR
jgi:copper transport protein